MSQYQMSDGKTRFSPNWEGQFSDFQSRCGAFPANRVLNITKPYSYLAHNEGSSEFFPKQNIIFTDWPCLM